MNEEEYIYVKKRVKELTKLDLNNYNSSQMMRRLDSYIARSQVKNVTNYIKRLDKDTPELTKLQDFLTINVSEFFRDTMHFTALQDKILPDLLRQNKKLNIWSAGSSNGAEAYSLAMLLDNLTPRANHRILATDIDKSILSQAAAGGPFRPDEVRNVAKFRGSKHLTCKDGGHWVAEDLRKKVSFRQQDLTKDTFERGFDLIMCRNVVIYFSDEAKKLLKKKFHEALKPNGVLFIGGTETMLDATEMGFQRIVPCFYRKTTAAPSNNIATASKVAA